MLTSDDCCIEEGAHKVKLGTSHNTSAPVSQSSSCAAPAGRRLGTFSTYQRALTARGAGCRLPLTRRQKCVRNFSA